MIKAYVFYISLAVAFAAGASGAAWVQENRYDAIIAEKEKTIAEETTRKLQEAAEKIARAETALTAAELDYLEKLKAKNEEINRLSNPAKPSRVFVDAKCPPAPANVPETAGTAVDGTAELTEKSRQLYYRHRALIAQYEETVILCRRYAETMNAF
jgi:hypothetical protein